MTPARQVIREYRWREIFPALMLLRVFRCSVRIHAILLSLIATILISQGWKVCAYFALPDEHPIRRQIVNREVAALPPLVSSSKALSSASAGWGQLLAPMQQEFERFAQPVRNFFSLKLSNEEKLFYLLGFAWTLLVGAFFAGVISRTAVFDLASQERYGVFRALRFVALRFRSFLGAPLMPLLLLGGMLIPVFLLGAAAEYISTFIASLLWGFAVIWGLVLGMVAILALFSWPLYWPALATEDADSFDALGSSIGYVSQRPFSYFLYAMIAAIISGAGLVLFVLLLLFGQTLLHFGMTTGGGAEIADKFLGLSFRPTEELTTSMLGFWDYLATHLIDAYLFSAFWTSATGVYLLLRYDVDRAELDDIYRDGAEDEKPMPKLAREMGLTGETASMESPVTSSAPAASPETPKAEQ
jgi:hypothetical protein